MEQIKYKNIRGIHLEPSTKCNAACAMCNRNYKGSVRKGLKITELSLDDCKKILEPDFLKQIELISLCGVLGEPITNSAIIDIVKYLFDCNPNMQIDLYTNGGIHDKSWWHKLAETIGQHKGYVIFGIDGASEISSLHRCNTDFNIVIRNAQAFIEAGGKAKWDYIVFKHNEHEVEKARELAEKLGFLEFNIKKTSRFFKSLYEKDKNLDSTIEEYGKHPVYNSLGEIEYYLEPPTNPAYRNKAEENIFKYLEDFGTYDNYLDNVRIQCGAINSGGIFISATGEVYPCCTVYQQVCYGSIFGVTDETELNEYKIYQNAKTELSALKLPIKDIVDGYFFKALQSCWHKCSLKDGKPKSCSRTCAVGLNPHQEQHSK